ncbi:hypothetical protein H6758_02485 [Candidatus Nomurabacteria bacterium]|nr:hypothetical protein [Candidatus Nomurabacteria bacterium]
MSKKEEYKPDIPKSLKKVELRLLEIEEEKPRRIHNLQETFAGDYIDRIMEEGEIKYLDTEKAQLLLQRQFLIDKRNDWKRKILWDILVPLIVATATSYLVTNWVR